MILNGWKEIANYLKSGVRTVQRWECDGMPTHRPRGGRPPVCAYSEELDRWLKTRPEISHDVDNNDLHQFKHRVLVVDDDEATLMTTAAILSREGCEVMTARDGFEALTALRGGVPEILISDLKMPNMSGFELLAVVRKRFPGVGVIARSGEFSPLAMPEGVLADRFLGKGENSISELSNMVRELLSESPLRSQPARPGTAPAWLPRSAAGYVVLTCPMCLRSFSVPSREIEAGVLLKDSCVHCGVEVQYRIDSTIAKTA
jgi:CheY-like chemotaxis protein